jgi:D-alanyl-D-alanine carboxypeptidase/D-alanyl-D-alanine-endopeptidase (penicillin-binding protein 4)
MRVWTEMRSAALIVVAALSTGACKSAPQSAALPGTPPVAAGNPRAIPPDRARLEPQPFPGPTLVAPAARGSELAQFVTSVDSMVNDAPFRNANWGILVVDPLSGDTLYSHNAGKLFMPASNQKIVTMAVGLTQLGPNYVWRTPVEMRGVLKQHTFTGDVVVHGRGDPSWSDAMRNGTALSAVAPIADALASRGITHIVGNITVEDNAFSDAPYGFGWAFDDFDDGYSAPIDELLFNEGFFTLTVRATRKTAALLTATTSPTRTYPHVIVQAVARARTDSSTATNRLEAKWDSTASAVVVRGTLPAGDSARIDLAYRHPNDAALAAIREMLAERGVTITAPPANKVSSRQGHAPLGVSLRMSDTLVVLTSPPLRDVLKRLAKPSQNQIAEVLFKTTALEATGFGRADSARAVVERQLATWGVSPDAIAVRDGSGLSRHDYVTPTTLVQILNVMRTSPSFDAYYAALPIAGVDGTLAGRMKGTAAAGNVHAKTGTVDKARSLSGYVTTADGRMLLFSFLCNNYTVPTRAVERVQDAIAVRLASMNLHEARNTP